MERVKEMRRAQVATTTVTLHVVCYSEGEIGKKREGREKVTSEIDTSKSCSESVFHSPFVSADGVRYTHTTSLAEHG